MRRKWALGLVVAALMAGGLAVVGDNGGGRRRGGVLRLGFTPIGSLDPAQARTIEQVIVADQLFDSLTAVDPVSSAVVPALARRWSASPDQRQWEFVLRPGAVFANGRAVTSADVKYSLERIARPGSASPAVDLLTSVAGFSEFRQGAADLVGVTAPEPSVVRISLQQSWAVLPAVLASPVFGVVPKEAVEAVPPAPAFAENPVGSGPFRFGRRDGPTITLPAAPGSRALVEGLEITVFDDVASSYRAFGRGQVDWSRVPPEEVDAAGRRYGRSAFTAYLAELFYGFNLENPTFADRRFREAIVRGIDRRAIVAAVYQGTASALDGVLLRGAPGFQEGACERCAYDPDQARRLLAEAFPGRRPPDIGLDYDDEPGQEAIARAMQVELSRIGVRALLQPRPVAEYDEFAVSGQQQLFRLGWIAAYSSPDAVLAPLFASGSPSNLTGFRSEEVDAQLLRARAEPDPVKRAGFYREAERAVLDQVPVVPIAQFELHTVVAHRVRNLRSTSLGSFDASVVWLDR